MTSTNAISSDANLATNPGQFGAAGELQLNSFTKGKEEEQISSTSPPKKAAPSFPGFGGFNGTNGASGFSLPPVAPMPAFTLVNAINAGKSEGQGQSNSFALGFGAPGLTNTLPKGGFGGLGMGGDEAKPPPVFGSAAESIGSSFPTIFNTRGPLFPSTILGSGPIDLSSYLKNPPLPSLPPFPSPHQSSATGGANGGPLTPKKQGSQPSSFSPGSSQNEWDPQATPRASTTPRTSTTPLRSPSTPGSTPSRLSPQTTTPYGTPSRPGPAEPMQLFATHSASLGSSTNSNLSISQAGAAPLLYSGSLTSSTNSNLSISQAGTAPSISDLPWKSTWTPASALIKATSKPPLPPGLIPSSKESSDPTKVASSKLPPPILNTPRTNGIGAPPKVKDDSEYSKTYTCPAVLTPPRPGLGYFAFSPEQHLSMASNERGSAGSERPKKPFRAIDILSDRLSDMDLGEQSSDLAAMGGRTTKQLPARTSPPSQASVPPAAADSSAKQKKLEESEEQKRMQASLAAEARKGEEDWVRSGGILRKPNGDRDYARTEEIKKELRLRDWEQAATERWEDYERRWKEIAGPPSKAASPAAVSSSAASNTGPSCVTTPPRRTSVGITLSLRPTPVKSRLPRDPSLPLHFEDIPWPVDLRPLPPHPSETDPSAPPPSDSPAPDSPIDLTDLTVANLQSLLLEPLRVRGCKVTRKERLRSALLRWHPDKVTGLVLRVVPEDVEKVQDGVHAVFMCLQELSGTWGQQRD